MENLTIFMLLHNSLLGKSMKSSINIIGSIRLSCWEHLCTFPPTAQMDITYYYFFYELLFLFSVYIQYQMTRHCSMCRCLRAPQNNDFFHFISLRNVISYSMSIDSARIVSPAAMVGFEGKLRVIHWWEGTAGS